MSKTVDICIVGGGLVGLSLAKQLSDAGISTVVIEGGKPQSSWSADEPAIRVSAINRSSELYLCDLGIWNDISADSITPYTDMQVWDATGSGNIHMSCLEVGETELGHIIENRAILKALTDSCFQADQHLQLFYECFINSVEGTPGNWHLTLSNDKHIDAKLLVGADGANSWLRKTMEFQLQEKPYDQQAIVAVIETEKSHQHTAWQRFLPTGPLAFLPLHQINQCSIVWSVETNKAKQLQELSDEAFVEALEKAIAHQFGQLTLLSRVYQFPLIQRHAKTYIKPGVVLVGDAAHTIHPLAGQGVNLGFKDAKILGEVLIHAASDRRLIYAQDTLSKYEQQRRLDNQLMIEGMGLFKSLFSNEFKALGLIRNIGLTAADRIKPLKAKLIRQAMGV